METGWEPFDERALQDFESENGDVNLSLHRTDADGELPSPSSSIDQQLKKWNAIRLPIHPEPIAIQPVTYGVENTLRARFQATGLQVIVQMTSFELNPDAKSKTAASFGWKVRTTSYHPPIQLRLLLTSY